MTTTGDMLPEPKDGSSCKRRQLYASGYSICNRTKLVLLSGAAVFLLGCIPARAAEGVPASPVEGSGLESYQKEGIYFRIHSGATALLDDEDYDQWNMKLRHQAQRRERLYSKARRASRLRRGRGLAAGTIANVSVEGRTFFNPSLYFIKITLGSQMQEFRVQLDTGSDLFWVPCNCQACATGSDYYQSLFPYYKPSASTTSVNISCSSSDCTNIQQSFGGPFPNACQELLPSDNLCEYNITYGDGSFTAGDVYNDVLYLPANPEGTANISGPVVFGCGEDQGGNLVDGSNPVEGLMGLSRSGLSVVNQLSANADAFSNSFSLCLEGQTKGGHMLVGRTSLASGAVYVPQITDQVVGQAPETPRGAAPCGALPADQGSEHHDLTATIRGNQSVKMRHATCGRWACSHGGLACCGQPWSVGEGVDPAGLLLLVHFGTTERLRPFDSTAWASGTERRMNGEGVMGAKRRFRAGPCRWVGRKRP